MTYDIIVIGAGIVGLSSALQLLQKRPSYKVLVIEKEPTLGMHQTGHNSGVIHSGIYYKPGSAKAKNCKIGYQKLLDFAKEHNIQHEICGKVIVATRNEQKALLDNIFERGVANGLTGLRYLSEGELREREPNVSAVKSLLVPQAGIIDYKEVAAKYLELFLNLGGEVRFSSKVQNIMKSQEGLVVSTSTGDFLGKKILNCAGLYSDKIARKLENKLSLKIIPFRGEYYLLKPEKENLIRHLVYPVPDPNFPFLGVHFTRMIRGGVEAGPNAVLAFAREGYTKYQIHMPELVESLCWPGFQKVAWKYWKTGMGEMYRSFSKRAFVKALQELVPAISESDLIPGGSGVRAQACDRNGKLCDDFEILVGDRVVNVCNAPSPAATSSLAIGEHISDQLLLAVATQ